MKSNITGVKLVRELEKMKEPVWGRVVEELAGPARRNREVNLSDINRHQSGTVLVPGKVLGTGSLTKKVDVAAFRFSKTAREKITKAGGKAMSIGELAKQNPKCSNVKIMV
ncbi:MAG: 50S ribosomal protein L18e [Candidatus Aenigmarchaeota archaeon]|nr:50S ribosomal protein L18e [Candidatus Aenigmarchaeota archaeon]